MKTRHSQALKARIYKQAPEWRDLNFTSIKLEIVILAIVRERLDHWAITLLELLIERWGSHAKVSANPDEPKTFEVAEVCDEVNGEGEAGGSLKPRKKVAGNVPIARNFPHNLRCEKRGRVAQFLQEHCLIRRQVFG